MAHQSYFLSVDIGTTTSKGTIIDQSGNVVSENNINHSGIFPKPGWHEHDPEKMWWEEFIQITRGLLARLGSAKPSVEAISVSGVWPSFCPTDSQGNPLYNAILYDDERSVAIVKDLKKQLGENLYGYELIPRILWLKNQLPDIWSKTRMFFSTHNYIIYKLTSTYCLDGHTAFSYGTGFDEENFEWDKSILSNYDIPINIMPKVFAPSKIAGYLNEEPANILGLKSGIPLTVSTGDSFTSILGSGANKIGDRMLLYGSVGILLALTHDVDFIFTSESYKDGDEGTDWLLSLSKSGKQLEWVARLLTGKLVNNIPVDLAYLDELTNSIPKPSSIKFFYDIPIKQKDIILAKTPHACFFGLTQSSLIGELYLAVLEAFGFCVKKNIQDVYIDKSNVELNRLFAAGGGARSKTWRQIVSDITGFEQLYLPDSIGAYGGALLAAISVGKFNFRQLENLVLERALKTIPNYLNFQLYEKSYSDYLHILNLFQTL
ncbi:sugar (pentulose and hexulose) kinase [Longilinea arvoryzae]|uniref:Sugar (Pentulose and hexulose) kinase n=1 Tax=Longilinea arvoryzae TaxID=360412 RepID=A0A0S7BGD7_9CHLR|nr:FGGY family carbohydrate kinase [Longilinea arvoryzae]GAP13224.1 sugar (pentulose and hexulose) kinase [Longilinea arvoryzae]